MNWEITTFIAYFVILLGVALVFYFNGTNKPPRFFSFPHGVTVTGLQKTNSKPKDYWNQKCFPSMICACSPVPSCSV